MVKVCLFLSSLKYQPRDERKIVLYTSLFESTYILFALIALYSSLDSTLIGDESKESSVETCVCYFKPSGANYINVCT